MRDQWFVCFLFSFFLSIAEEEGTVDKCIRNI